MAQRSKSLKLPQTLSGGIGIQTQAARPQLVPKFKLLTGLPLWSQGPQRLFPPYLAALGPQNPKGCGKPAHSTLGKYRFEPHFGPLFSSVQSQATVLPFPAAGDTPRTTGQMDKFLPAYIAPAHQDQAHLRPDMESGGWQASPACCVTKHFPSLVLTSSCQTESFQEIQSLISSLPPATGVVTA